MEQNTEPQQPKYKNNWFYRHKIITCFSVIILLFLSIGLLNHNHNQPTQATQTVQTVARTEENYKPRFFKGCMINGSETQCNCLYEKMTAKYSLNERMQFVHSNKYPQAELEMIKTCFSPSPTDTPEPTLTPKPTLTPDQIIANFQKEAQVVTVADIYKTPNSYKGKSLIFTCTVSGFPKDINGDVAGLNCDDLNDFSSNVQVGIDKSTDVTKINQNDTIKVYGMGLGADTGKNAFGADITTGVILGLYINDLTTGYKNY